jgi:hypothetical protein
MHEWRKGGREEAYANHIFTVCECFGNDGAVLEGILDLTSSPLSVAMVQRKDIFSNIAQSWRDLRQVTRDQTGLSNLEPIKGSSVCRRASARAFGHVDHNGSLGMGPLTSKSFKGRTSVIGNCKDKNTAIITSTSRQWLSLLQRLRSAENRMLGRCCCSGWMKRWQTRF